MFENKVTICLSFMSELFRNFSGLIKMWMDYHTIQYPALHPGKPKQLTKKKFPIQSFIQTYRTCNILATIWF